MVALFVDSLYHGLKSNLYLSNLFSLLCFCICRCGGGGGDHLLSIIWCYFSVYICTFLLCFCCNPDELILDVIFGLYFVGHFYVGHSHKDSDILFSWIINSFVLIIRNKLSLF